MKHQAKLVEWKEKILDCRSCGGNVKLWCAENKVSEATYYRWEREIFGSVKRGRNNEIAVVEPAVAEPAFAELPPPAQMEPTPTPPVMPQLVASIRLEKGELNIYSGADMSVIKLLCRALNLC